MDIVSMNVVLKPCGKIMNVPVIQITTVVVVKLVTLGVTNVLVQPIMIVDTVFQNTISKSKFKVPTEVLVDQTVQPNNIEIEISGNVLPVLITVIDVLMVVLTLVIVH
jgi:hypothetical protein